MSNPDLFEQLLNEANFPNHVKPSESENLPTWVTENKSGLYELEDLDEKSDNCQLLP